MLWALCSYKVNFVSGSFWAMVSLISICASCTDYGCLYGTSCSKSWNGIFFTQGAVQISSNRSMFENSVSSQHGQVSKKNRYYIEKIAFLQSFPQSFTISSLILFPNVRFSCSPIKRNLSQLKIFSSSSVGFFYVFFSIYRAFAKSHQVQGFLIF